MLAVYDGADNLLERFIYVDSRLPMAMQSGGNTFYLAYDQVGSIISVADVSGNVIKSLTYDSFGNIIQDTNPLFDMPVGFAGGIYDPDTGLVRFGFREYSPEIGRWTAKDPILFSGGDSDLYGYCLNDPINLIDPLGLFDIHARGSAQKGAWTYEFEFYPTKLQTFDREAGRVATRLLNYFIKGLGYLFKGLDLIEGKETGVSDAKKLKDRLKLDKADKRAKEIFKEMFGDFRCIRENEFRAFMDKFLAEFPDFKDYYDVDYMILLAQKRGRKLPDFYE